jgi:flavin reductase (DIM6/NTAB) family NADH-FMN oxidoreductase RutF
MQATDAVSAELTQGMKQAMRRLAASVVVVTARDGDTRYAMAASSCTSLSMEPPSIIL